MLVKKWIIPLVLFSCSGLSAEEDRSIKFGGELDALPYLTGGYYLSAWAGKDNIRLRGIVASINIPEFAVESGFENNKLKAYALVVDYFPSKDFTGTWYGVGIEKWDSEIKSQDENATAKYSNVVLTAGGGYLWYFNKYFYLNPWVAAHAVVGGDESVNVGSRTLNTRKITAEVSLKIGFKY